MQGFVYDTESDTFYPEAEKLWTICLIDIQTQEKFTINPFKDFTAKAKFLNTIFKYENPVLAAHNQAGHDLFILMKLLGIEFTVGKDTIEDKPVQFIDTFYLSMFLNPDRAGHSIEYFGEILKLPKIDFRQASIDAGIIEKSSPQGSEFKQHSNLMDEYCLRDTEVNYKVLKLLFSEWENIYREPFSFTDAFKCGQKSFYLMSCQEITGWKFNLPLAKELEIKIQDMMEEIRASVEPQLPPRGLKKTEEKEYTMPAKPFKKDGSLSSHGLKFIEKHKGKDLGEGWYEFYGRKYQMKSLQLLDVTMPMEMANQAQMKEWFLEQEWKPTLFNFKRGPDGKPMRDEKTRQLIKTTPKIQEAGRICPNLMKMEGDLVKQVVKWLSLRNRLSVLQGWMGNPRLQIDGRIGAGRTGIASTHRQKHRTIVNVPKASDKVLLGKEFRSLWIAEEGMTIAAGDASALEARVQGHYTYRYDNGETANILLSGDPHSRTAKSVYGDILAEFDIESPDFDKDHPVFKPYRDRSKNLNYAIMYGCAGPKAASTAGLPENQGQEVVDRFWAANDGTKQLKDNLEAYWEMTGKKQFLPAIDGRVLRTRKKSALLNTIFQSCGAITMDYACCFMDMWLGGLKWEDGKPLYIYKKCVVKRIGYVHDEIEFECDPKVADEVARMIERAIQKAGEHLKLNVPLSGEGKVGLSWKEVH